MLTRWLTNQRRQNIYGWIRNVKSAFYETPLGPSLPIEFSYANRINVLIGQASERSHSLFLTLTCRLLHSKTQNREYNSNENFVHITCLA